MKREDDKLIWIIVAALGAILIGCALMPLRGLTSASNLAFVFLAFTIVVAELGGRSAALIAALLSAMSLNFFLTEPYLELTISKRDDLIAFLALVICGLISAAFGKQRKTLSAAALKAGQEIDILKRLVDNIRSELPLNEILRDLKRSFALGAVVLRDAGGKVLATAESEAPPADPQIQLTPGTLFPTDETKHRYGAKGFRLPQGGGRLSVQSDQGNMTIDLWEGDEQGMTLAESRTLAIAILILVVELSRRRAAQG